jgi:hypothetical protein
MLHESASATSALPQDREIRRQQFLQALRRQAEAVLERLAEELVDLPEDKVFGQIEYTLRDLSLELATRAHQAGIDAGKKKATKAPASSARTARPTPASSTIAPKTG